MRNFNYKEIKIKSIASALPENKAGNEHVEQAMAKEEQTTADLGFLAAQNSIKQHKIEPHEIGVLVFLSKTPDYRGPATAMVLQNRLIIPKDCIVYDAPTGNAGFENAMNIGASLLQSIHHQYALVVFGDTISKQLSQNVFLNLKYQDGATAVLLEKAEANDTQLATSFTTRSAAWNSFMIPSGGFRNTTDWFEKLESKRAQQQPDQLHVNSAKITAVLEKEIALISDQVIRLINQDKDIESLVFLNLLMPEIETAVKQKLDSKMSLKAKVLQQTTTTTQTMGATIPLMMAATKEGLENKEYQFISVSMGEGLVLSFAAFNADRNTILNTIYSDVFYENGAVTHEM